MKKFNQLLRKLFSVIVVVGFGLCTYPAFADTAQEIDQKVDRALQTLYGDTPAALELSKIAKGILVFPEVVKGGFIVGAQYGQGALRKGDNTAGYYKTVAASYGLQAGAQKFGYVLIFITDAGLKYLDSSNGWEIGVGPSVVVVEKGLATSLTTTTAKDDVYAFFFSQEGLMAGLGVQGSKITKIIPDN